MFALSNNPINPRMSSSFNRKRLAAEDPGSWGEISSAAKRLHLDQLIQKLSLYESVSASDNAPSLDACHEVDMDIRTEEQKKHVLWISDLAEELKQADEEERRNLLEKYPRLWSLTQAVDTRQQDQKPDLLQMPSSISASEPPPLPPLPFDPVLMQLMERDLRNAARKQQESQSQALILYQPPVFPLSASALNDMQNDDNIMHMDEDQ